MTYEHGLKAGPYRRTPKRFSMQASLHTKAVQLNQVKADKQSSHLSLLPRQSRRKIPSKPDPTKKVAGEWQGRVHSKLGRKSSHIDCY